MTEESRKAQVGIGVDSSEAKQGFAEVKAAAVDAAQGIAQAGETAARGVEAIGDKAAGAATKVEAASKRIAEGIKKSIPGAPGGPQLPDPTPAFEKLTAAQSRYLASLERQAVIATQGKASYLELRAAQLGVGDAAAASIEKIRAAEAATSGLGMSAKATTAALRQVPAQFTDIVTSLASGQAPMTVLIQQGGQLKDVFGGVGPAARALGGYVLGLVNPLTLALAATVGITAAWHMGAEEARGFENAVTLSGNAVGLSVSKYTELRDVLGSITTRGKAAEVLTEIAKNGEIAAGNVQLIAEAAVLMEKATGQSIGKTVEQFAKLADEPSKAALELNKSTNFLTASIFQQIRALEEQGQKTKAAELATTTFAQVTRDRAASVVENVGTMERAWRGLVQVIKSAGDAALAVGRQQSTAQQLADVQAEIRSASGQDPNRRFRLPGQDSLDTLKQREAFLQENLRLEQRAAERAADRARIERLAIDFTKQGDEFKTKSARRDEEIRKAQIEGQELINRGLLTEKDLRDRIANIREKYKETGAAGTGESEVAGIAAKLKERQDYLARLQGEIAGGGNAKIRELTEGEKLVIKLNEELKTSITGVARAQKEKALEVAKELAQTDKQIEGTEARKKALEALQVTLDKQVDAARQEASRAKELALGQEAANAAYGKSKTAIEQLALAQAKANLAEAEASDGRFRADYVAALRDKVEWLTRYTQALQDAEFKQKALSLAEAGRTAGEEAETLRLELSLLGETQQARERILALRRVEVKLAKELADIEKLNLGEGPQAELRREELRATARRNAVIESENALNKTVVAEWQRAADSMNNSLTDALLRGFESGKSASENLIDTVKNQWKTLVLRPTIQAIMAPVSGTLTSIGQGIGNAITGGGGSAASGLSGIANLFSGGNPISSIGSLLGLGGAAAGGATVGTAASLGAGLEAYLGAQGTFATAGATSAGLLGSLSSIAGPVGLALMAASLFAKKGETRYGGQYLNTSLEQGPSGGQIEGAPEAIANTIASINSTLTALGASSQIAEFYSGLEQSERGKGFVYGGAKLTTGQVVGENLITGYQNRRGSKTKEEALQQFLEELNQVKLQAIQASDAVDPLAEYVRSLGDVSQKTGAELAAAVSRVDKALAEKQAFEERLFQLTATEEEKIARTRERELAAIDETNRAIAQRVYAEEDLKRAHEEAAQTAQAESRARQRARAEEIADMRKQAEEQAKAAEAVRTEVATLSQQLLLAGDAAGALQQRLRLSTATTESQFGVDRALAARDLGSEASRNALRIENVREVMGYLQSVTDAMTAPMAQAISQAIVDASGASNGAAVRAAVGAFAETFAQQQARELYGPRGPGLASVFAAQDSLRIASAQGFASGQFQFGADVVAYGTAVSGLKRQFEQGVLTAEEYEGALAEINRLAPGAADYLGNTAAQLERIKGAAFNLAQTGLDAISYYFGELGKQAEELAAAAAKAGEPIAQTTAAIGRLMSVQTAFGASVAAVRGGLANSGELGQQMLASELQAGSTTSRASLIAEAARIAAGVLTTADAAAAAKRLAQSDAFKGLTAAGIRDASLLLDGVRQYDSAGLERAMTRINAALARGKLTEDQYLAVFGVGLDMFRGLTDQVGEATNEFGRLQRAMREMRYGLLVDPERTTLDPAARLQELERQRQIAKRQAATGDEDAIARFQELSNAILDKTLYATADDYRAAFDRIYDDALQLELTGSRNSTTSVATAIRDMHTDTSARLKRIEEVLIAGLGSVSGHTGEAAALLDQAVNGTGLYASAPPT